MAGDFSVKYKSTVSSVPWDGVVILAPDGYVETSVYLGKGIYNISLVLKNNYSSNALVQVFINGKNIKEIDVDPVDFPAESVAGWLVPRFEYKASKNGKYKIKIKLSLGKRCAFHRCKIVPLLIV